MLACVPSRFLKLLIRTTHETAGARIWARGRCPEQIDIDMLFQLPRSLLVTVVAFSAALLAQVLLGEPTFLQTLTSEDHLIENLTVLAYLIGVVVAVMALWHKRFRLFAGLWLVLCIFFAGEETSWFQRIIGYNVPVVEQSNSQSEFNIHNLDFMHGNKDRAFISADEKVRFGWRHLLRSQSLFRVGFFGYFLILPLMLLVPWGRRIAQRIGLPGFDWTALAVTWELIAITIPMTLLVELERRLAIAECRELVYALTIVFYITGFGIAQTTAKESVRS